MVGGASTHRLTNLPAPRTRLIGRETDVAAVRDRVLRAHGRPVTLVGAGGSGKTALAFEVARGLLGDFDDGVWLVELAPLGDPTLVPQAVASVFGVREGAGRTLQDALAAYLESRSLLLVVDNAEHLIEAVAALCERLLTACPHLRLLVTSRESLRIRGELSWRVPTLAVPDPRRPGRPEELARFAAVQLFAERAAAVQPTFDLTPQNASAVASVCAQLDGIPLALELAGARARTLTAEQILARLDDRFRLLSGGPRAVHSRQQTMRATLDWSHALLSEAERVLFRRLAVFAGGWDLEAAEAVCSGDGVVTVLDLLDRLAEKSLVLVDATGAAARYRFLEPIRQYAAAHLEAAAEAQTSRARHASHYLTVAEQIAAALWDGRILGPFGSPTQLTLAARLEREHDNLRGALGWAEECEESETLARLARALHGFCFLQGFMAEGSRWAEKALAHSDGLPAALRAQVVGMTADILAWGRGDHDAALGLYQSAAAQFAALGDNRNYGHMLMGVGAELTLDGDAAAGPPFYEESVAVFRALDDPWGTAWALVDYGWILRQGGDRRQAQALTEEALNEVRRAGDVWLLIQVLTALGGLVLEGGDLERAQSLAREALALLRDSGVRWCLPECLELAAGVGGSLGRAGAGARLFGAAEAIREMTGADRFIGRAAYPAFVRMVRANLDDRTFDAAWLEGRRLSIEQAIDEALQAVQPLPAGARAGAKAAGPRSADALTAREQEVAALLARGFSNAQIAERLVVAKGTVDTHVHHILEKLGCSSRAQVAVWAASNGLLDQR
jgi:non-specific serine/threonine protein kinase